VSTVIEELKLENFEGYRRAELKFSAGLNLIKGRNSTGKSTLLDALVYALFGEAPDVKPKLLVSRLPGSREMSVYTKFISPRSRETVEIGRRGKIDSNGAYKTEERLLRVNGKEVTIESDEDLRARITELMGVSLRKFLNLVYVRQGKLPTILEPPREEMDSVIGITLLRELREQLQETRKILEKYEGKDVATEAQNLEKIIIPRLLSDTEGLNKDVGLLQAGVKELDDLVRKSESPELSELLRHIKEKEEIETDIGNSEAKIQELLRIAGVSSLEEFESKVRTLETKKRGLSKKLEKAQSRVNTRLNAWSTAGGDAGSLEREITEHQALIEKGISKCPTCGQDLDPAILQRIMEDKKVRLKKLRSAEARAKTAYDRRKSEFDQLSKDVVTLDTGILTLNSTNADIRSHLDATRSLDETKRKLLPLIGSTLNRLGLSFRPDDPELMVKVAQRLPVQPEELVKRKSELQEKQKTLEEKVGIKKKYDDELRSAKERLGMLGSRIDQAKVAHSLSDRFDEGVEARRKMVLRSVEFKALEYYKAMTDQHIYGAITVDPDTYAMWAHPKGLTESIPATRVGGGHQTIIALSMRLALLDVLGFRSLLILDEPTYGVDSGNLPQLASYIGEASKRLSQMILVTHHNICEEEASNIIEVRVGEDRVSRAEISL